MQIGIKTHNCQDNVYALHIILLMNELVGTYWMSRACSFLDQY